MHMHILIHMTWHSPITMVQRCTVYPKLHSESKPCSTLRFLLEKFLKQARNSAAYNLRWTQAEGPDFSPLWPSATLPKQQGSILIHKKSLCNQPGNFYLYKGQSGLGKRDWETDAKTREMGDRGSIRAGLGTATSEYSPLTDTQ